MPIYEYICEDCQTEFEKIVINKQQEISCPKCAGTKNKIQLSVFATANGNGSKAVAVAKPEELRNHRLIVMFFDLTSMQPEDLDRSVEAAKAFLRTKMQPADLVALVSLGDTLTVTASGPAAADAVSAAPKVSPNTSKVLPMSSEQPLAPPAQSLTPAGVPTPNKSARLARQSSPSSTSPSASQEPSSTCPA